jgi:hypothetical protein
MNHYFIKSILITVTVSTCQIPPCLITGSLACVCVYGINTRVNMTGISCALRQSTKANEVKGRTNNLTS